MQICEDKAISELLTYLYECGVFSKYFLHFEPFQSGENFCLSRSYKAVVTSCFACGRVIVKYC